MFKNRKCPYRRLVMLNMKIEFYENIKNRDFPIFFDLIKWKLIDLRRFFKYGSKLHLYGVRCITGMYGCGKTITMTKIALDFRKKYGDKIYICTNFSLSIQDFAFTHINQTIKQYDKPIIFFWDEVQNDFPAQEKVFPREVRQALTLNRKGNGKMFYWASQDHELVHKTIRRLTIEYALVKTLFGRLTKVKWYHDYDYHRLFNENDINKKIKIHAFKRDTFIQTDYLRSLYNSFSWNNGESLSKA